MRYVLAILLVLVAGNGLIGCGPIKTTLLFQDVTKELKAAERNEADQKIASVYYYWAAREYFTKAKQEHGYSDFDESEILAKKALELARTATAKAETGKKRVVEPEDLEQNKKGAKSKSKRRKSKARNR